MDHLQWLAKNFPGLEYDGLWSILPDTAYFLYTVIVQKQPQNILELGSGVSTIIMAKAASYYGGYVHSLEHSPHWVKATRCMCRKHKINSAHVIYAPIETIDDGRKMYHHQKIPKIQFDFAFIDGPPGYPEQTAPGRRATLHGIWPYLKNDAVIIVDDGNREPERAAIMEWMVTFQEKLTVQYLQLTRPIFFVNINKNTAILQNS